MGEITLELLESDPTLEDHPMATLERMATTLDLGDVGYIYFLIKESQIIYVGQSIKLHVRIAAHKIDKDFDSVKYIQVPKSKLTSVEGACIRALNPQINKAGKSKLSEDDIELLVKYKLLGLLKPAQIKYGAYVNEGEYGPVIIYTPSEDDYPFDEYHDKVGYYDNDEYECECEDLEDGQECFCPPMAIVYFESLARGYCLIPLENLRHLPPHLEKSASNKLYEKVVGKILLPDYLGIELEPPNEEES